METNIQKWGNSLGVRLPLALTQKKALKAGSRVLVTETKSGLAIEVIKKPSLNLATLLQGITEKNIHSETDWSGPVGKEIW
jgi:antitoxin MazE